MCVEFDHPLAEPTGRRSIRELRAVGRNVPAHPADQLFLPHSGFPVDVRHNSKIFREKLAVWAEKKLGSNGTTHTRRIEGAEAVR